MVREHFKPKKPQIRERVAEEISNEIGKRFKEGKKGGLLEERLTPARKKEVAENLSEEIGDEYKKRRERVDRTRNLSSETTRVNGLKTASSQREHERYKEKDHESYPLGQDTETSLRNMESSDAELTETRKKFKDETEVDTTGFHETKHESPQNMLIRSKEDLDNALDHHLELQLNKGFERRYKESIDYFEHSPTDSRNVPTLVQKLDRLELHRWYEEVHSGPTNIGIDSMDDVDKLLDKYPQEKEKSSFSESYRRARVFFDVNEDSSKTQQELAKEHGIPQQRISEYQSGKEPGLVSALRRYEEDRIIDEWTELDLSKYAKLQIRSAISPGLEDTQDANTKKMIDSQEHKDDTVLRIDPNVVYGALLGGNPESCSVDKLTDAIMTMTQGIPMTRAGVYYAELSSLNMNPNQLSETMREFREHRNEIEHRLGRELGFNDSTQSIRIAVVDNRICCWNLDASLDDMMNVWRNQYFYLNSRHLMEMTNDVGRQLGLNGSLSEKLAHLQEIANQVAPEAAKGHIKLGKQVSRINGEVLHFYRDVLGISNREIEKHVDKVTGPNGRGGIRNPRLLEGRELEMCRSKIIAPIICDGHITLSGHVQYVESRVARFDIVEKNVKQFGAIELPRIRRDGLYMTYFPSPLGTALLEWGMIPGDKAITNSGIPEVVFNSSFEAWTKFFSALVPEDGTVSGESGVMWSFSHALDAGVKAERYKFESGISRELKDFIEKHGADGRFASGYGYRSLKFSDILKLAKSPDSETRRLGEELLHSVYNHPNRLILDTKKLAERIGIEVDVRPIRVRYYLDSGRVSVAWSARPATIDDHIKFAYICPPNDTHKREKVKKWLVRQKRRKDVRDALDRSGIPIHDIEGENIE